MGILRRFKDSVLSVYNGKRSKSIVSGVQLENGRQLAAVNRKWDDQIHEDVSCYETEGNVTVRRSLSKVALMFSNSVPSGIGRFRTYLFSFFSRTNSPPLCFSEILTYFQETEIRSFWKLT